MSSLAPKVVAAAVVTAIAVAAIVLVARGGAGDAAQAARPSCVERLLHDWRDGRIDATYPIRCYRDAMRSLPADLQLYSSAHSDIQQALSRRLARGTEGRSTG